MEQLGGAVVARSWFYLALWHGTPEELTTAADVEITLCDTAEAKISTGDKLSAEISRSTDVSARITSADFVETEINILSEVVARVDANGD